MKLNIRWQIYLLLTLTIIAFFIRHYGIETKELWFDEIDLWYTALQDTPTTDAPLPSLILYVFFKITSATEYFFYLLPVILGTLSIPAYYLTSQKVDKDPIYNTTCAIFLTFSPLAIYYSQEGRSYALLLLLTCFLYLTFLNAYKDCTITNWIRYGIFTFLCCLTHLVTTQIILAFAVFMTIVTFTPALGGENNKNKFNRFVSFCIVSLISGVLGILDVFAERSNLYVLKNSNLYLGSTSEYLQNILAALSFTFSKENEPFGYLNLISIVFTNLFVLGIYQLIRKREYDMGIFWTFTLTIPSIFMFCTLGELSNWGWYRYISHLLIPFGLITCYGLSSLINKLSRNSTLSITLVVFFYLTSFSYGINKWRMIAPIGKGQIYSTMAKLIEKDKNKYSGIISDNDRILNLIHLHQANPNILPHYLLTAINSTKPNLQIRKDILAKSKLRQVAVYNDYNLKNIQPGLYGIISYKNKLNCKMLSKLNLVIDEVTQSDGKDEIILPCHVLANNVN